MASATTAGASQRPAPPTIFPERRASCRIRIRAVAALPRSTAPRRRTAASLIAFPATNDPMYCPTVPPSCSHVAPKVPAAPLGVSSLEPTGTEENWPFHVPLDDAMLSGPPTLTVPENAPEAIGPEPRVRT